MSNGLYCVFFFFFQAEDGIRDVAVTGVQTCALPIYRILQREPTVMTLVMRIRFGLLVLSLLVCATPAWAQTKRSEERRVGKECRSRGTPSSWKLRRDGDSSSLLPNWKLSCCV